MMTVHLSGGTSVFDVITSFSFGGTATGTDYSSLMTGEFTIPMGNTSGTFIVSGIDNILFDGDRTLILTIDSVTGGAQVGMDSSAMITIDDDEQRAPGGVSAGMNVWLKANEGVIGSAPVSTWTDSGDEANDATGVNNVSLVNDVINFNPAIEFDGTDDYFILPDATIPTGDSSYTMYVLDIPDTISSENVLINAGTQVSSQSLGITTNNAGNGTVTDYWFSDNLDTVAAPLVVGEPTLIASSYDNAAIGTNRYVYIDGVLSVSENEAAARATTSTSNFIGTRTDGTLDLDGKLPELVIYNRYLTTIELQKIDTYFAIKYGMTIGSGAVDYINATGVVVWDSTTNGMYGNDIAGIGKENTQ